MIIQNPKTYKGQEIETIFFRPSFCGASAQELGIRVLYNMPMPTTVQVWSHAENALQPFSSGWSGKNLSNKCQKVIEMNKVKAENSFSAEDYFSMIFEKITNSAEVSMGDLTGTELEKAETELFRKSIAENVRTTMWLGDTTGSLSPFRTFDGFLTAISRSHDAGTNISCVTYDNIEDAETGAAALLACWNNASTELHSLRSEGNLAYFVSSNIYNQYLADLDEKGCDAAYLNAINGHEQLYFRGIPVIEVPLDKYDKEYFTTFCVLTDRRNLVLALNTADMPENEVRMWYNPDEMENRQRATFLAGTAIIDDNLVSAMFTKY